MSSLGLAAQLCLLLILLLATAAFSSFSIRSRPSTRTTIPSRIISRTPPSPLYFAAISVPASELERDLTSDEKTVVKVVRQSGPAVAFVTSVLPPPETPSSSPRSRRRNQRRSRDDDSKNMGPPRGRSLGSGSGFLVDARGYIVTNFHVIESAHRLQTMALQMEDVRTQLVGNLTQILSSSSSNNATAGLLEKLLPPSTPGQSPLPNVYVRIDSATNYQLCRIVDVRPELDVAVLKIIDNEDDQSSSNNNITSSYPITPLQFGSSSSLLQGQDLIAIGSPFGLETTVTKGVVSALNRELPTSTTSPLSRSRLPPIRNAIQTDCSINPGNSGGPLLNMQGLVVGVNTAIVTTSGSSAGIGFAVEADQVAPVVADMIRRDVVARQQRPRAWLGVSIVAQNTTATSTETGGSGCIVATVTRDSPADRAGIRGLTVLADSARVRYGDRIVAVGGNAVDSLPKLRAELDSRVVGEQLPVTVEDAVTGKRRVVYLTLETASTA